MALPDEPHQPALELTTKSFTRGNLEGKPCVVVYDAATDETTVVAAKSKWYAQAMAALEILDAASVRLPASLQNPKTIVHRRTSKLILPGSHASN